MARLAFWSALRSSAEDSSEDILTEGQKCKGKTGVNGKRKYWNAAEKTCRNCELFGCGSFDAAHPFQI
jgi:hypothetical protein